MKARHIGVVVAIVVAMAIGIFYALRGRTDAPAVDETSKIESHDARPSVKVKRKKATSEKPKSVKRPPRRSDKPVLSFVDDDEEDDGFTPEERALSKRIEKALDDEDLSMAVACAKEAQNCQNVEVRQAMVDTLGWFGAKGLPELTPFLVDPNEDVRESALNEWSMALSDIEDDAEKIGVVELAMNVLTDEDALEEISGEYIGTDEKLAVESLLRIIEAGGSQEGIAKAKETYEFVTGDEFVSRAAAEKWIAEEYQPE